MSASPPGPPAAAAASSSAAVGDKRPRVGASSDRRVQPRHFHAGPGPQPGGDMAAAPSDARPQSPPVRLYRHALECVFAFFKLRELPTLMAVSHEWQAAVLSMKSLNAEVNIEHLSSYENPLDGLTAVCTSRLRCHVQQLDCSSFLIHPSALNMMSLNLPQLGDLAVFLQLSAVPPPFPTRLRKLRFRVESCEAEADASRVAFFQQTMRAIGSLKLLADLYIDNLLPDGVSLAPLSRLPQLRRLSIKCRGADWSDACVAELRSLANLEYVDLSNVELPLLSRVLAQPHSLRWQEVDGVYELTEPILQLLVSLPLTIFDEYLAMSHIDQLAQLPQLTDLRLNSSCRVQLDRPRIFHTLASLVQLHSLWLVDRDRDNALHFTCAELADVLPRLTQLQRLMIVGATRLTSLSFLTKGSLPRTLTSLNLSYFKRRMPLAELKHVLQLVNLESLSLWDAFDECIGPAGVLFFEPPMRARTFPRLKSFEYHWTPPPQAQ